MDARLVSVPCCSVANSLSITIASRASLGSLLSRCQLSVTPGLRSIVTKVYVQQKREMTSRLVAENPLPGSERYESIHHLWFEKSRQRNIQYLTRFHPIRKVMLAKIVKSVHTRLPGKHQSRQSFRDSQNPQKHLGFASPLSIQPISLRGENFK